MIHSLSGLGLERFFYILFFLPIIIAFVKMGKKKLKHKLDFTRTFKTKDIDLIHCGTFNGSITIRGDDSDEIELSATIFSKNPIDEKDVEKYVKMKEEGFELSVQTTSNIWKKYKIGVVEFEFKVPAFLSINANTANGNMEASKIEGGLILKTANGNVDVADTKGEVMVKTSNGDVKVSRGAIAKVRCANGNISLSKIEQFMSETANGNIAVESEVVSDNSNASSARGDITLQVNPFSTADISTTMGNISIEGFDDDTSNKKTTIGGDRRRLKSDGKYHLDVNTSMGDIKIEKT